jgi:adenosylcobalamin-dependent ribonucleoside-triphosphate reductase
MMDGIVAPRRASNLIVQDTREGWADALTWIIDQAYTDDPYKAQMTHVIDVSKVRPQGSPLVSSGGTAAGPAPLARMLVDVAEVINRIFDQDYMSPVDVMEIDHHISVGAIAGGKRRSARMSIVHWKDPYIMDFINSKNDGRLHWSTNLSVEIDSEFLTQLRLDKDPMQCNDYRAEIVHGAVCDAVLKNGEPGYWNSELSQIGETGAILSTNPCGEIPLEPWEACNLGHVNLDAFVDYENWNGYDWNGLVEAHRLVTRFLIRSTFADINDPSQREIQDKNRRIGVGHFGVQAFWAKQGVKYSDIPHSSGRNNPRTMLKMLYRHVRDTARDYAFELRIPEPVKVTTVAPTGTIAKLPGTTEGIHPIYGKWYERRVRFSKRDEREFGQVLDFMNQGFKIEDDIYDPSGMTSVVVFPTEDLLISQVRNLVARYDLDFDESVVQSADELSLRDMLDMQEMYQLHWADNAVSYTCNIAPGTIDSVELQEILKEFLPNLKGTTIMVDESREQAPYTRITQAEYAAAAVKRIEDSTDELCSTGACPVK